MAASSHDGIQKSALVDVNEQRPVAQPMHLQRQADIAPIPDRGAGVLEERGEVVLLERRLAVARIVQRLARVGRVERCDAGHCAAAERRPRRSCCAGRAAPLRV